MLRIRCYPFLCPDQIPGAHTFFPLRPILRLIDLRKRNTNMISFQLIDRIWKGSKGNETLHRICTMMRWMRAQSVVIETIDNSINENKRIFDEVRSIEKRLSCNISPEIYKLTFLQLELGHNESNET